MLVCVASLAGLHLVLQAQHFPLYLASLGPPYGLRYGLWHHNTEDVPVCGTSSSSHHRLPHPASLISPYIVRGFLTPW